MINSSTKINGNSIITRLLLFQAGLVIALSIFAFQTGYGQCGFSGLASSYCSDDAAVTLSEFTSGGAFSGSGISGSVFTPITAGAGTHTIDYINTNIYSVNTSGAFAPFISGTGWTTVSYGAGDLEDTDDQLSTAVNLGFSFDFFGSSYTQLFVSSNGNVAFTSYVEAAFNSAVIPSTASPDNMIALVRADLDPSKTITDKIEYRVEGVAPNRIFILNYEGVEYKANSDVVDVQLKLFETTNIIEIHTTLNNATLESSLQGIENASGTTGYTVPGRNNQLWSTTNDFVAFTPCSDSKSVTVYANPSANAGTGGDVCGKDAANPFGLSAVASSGTGLWSQVSGPGSSTFSSASSATSNVTANTYGTYVYRWTETNGTCVDFDELTVVYYQPTVADAGPASQDECDLNINLSGIQSISGSSASWTVTSGNAADISFSNANIFNPVATSTAYGTYTLQLTESNGTCSSTDNIVVTFTEQPAADAGTGGNVCGKDAGNPFSLSAVASSGTGLWSQVSGPGSSTFSSASSATSNVTANTYGTYVYRWTETNGSCVDFDEVTVVYYQPTVADAGPASQEECDLNINLSGIQSISGSNASWTVTSGNAADISFSNANIFNPVATSTTFGTYTLQLTESNGTCSSTDNIVVTFTEQPVADAGTGGSICGKDGGNPFSLSAVASSGTGLWSQVSGPGSSTFSAASSATSNVTANTYGTYVYRWTETNGTCVDFDEVTVVYYQPTVADAGPASQEECDLNINLSGIQSIPGSSASWTVTSGNAADISFSNANIFNPVATSTTYGTYTFQLTESNGTCSSTDNIVVTFTEQPAADAGTGGSVCGKDAANPFSLSAVASSGTGLWSQVSGPGSSTFSSATSAASNVTANTYGTYVYRWTETNGTCVDFDEVTVVYYQPTVADAGPASQEECDLNINLSGIQSISGSSASWTVTSGNAADISFSNANIFNPVATSTAYGTYTLQLTESNGTCSSTDNIVVTFTEQPSANAGSGGNVCGKDAGNPFSLSAVASSGTGLWSQVNGPGSSTFSSASSATSNVTANTYGTYVYRWTETNGSCVDFDELTVVYYQPTVADAGPASQEECDLNINLSGIQSISGSSASWTVTSGNAADISFSNANIFNPVATSTAYGTYTLQLTESNGTCSSTDNIVVTFTEQPSANAGSGGNVCGKDAGNPFSLSAVASSGTGLWSQVSGPGSSTFSSASSATSNVTANTYGTYVYRWTETNGSCVDFDEVTVVYYQPTVADAGPASQEECDLNINLSGIQSIPGSNANWTVTSGNAADISFSNANIFNPVATSTTYGTYTLQLTESNGTCSSIDNIVVTFTEQPVADAGTGGDVCGKDAGNPFSLSAVASSGTGLWSQVNGPGSSTFSSASSATSNVTANTYGTYVYRWTETNGSCVDFDEVTVVYYQPTVADAGPASQEECDLNINLSGIQSISGSSASWTVTSGNAADISFSNANIFNPVATSSNYGTYTLQLTESNGTCSSIDNIVVTFTEQPVADAGTGGNVCGKDAGNPFSLSATASSGTGLWSQVSGPGSSTFSSASSATSNVTANAYGTYVYRWTETNGSCVDFDEVTVIYYQPTVADAGPASQEECDLNINLSGIQSIPGSNASWIVTSGNAADISFSNANIFNPVATSTAYGTYTLQLTESNGTCSSTDNIVVTFTEQPVADAGTGGDVCGKDAGNPFSLSAVASSGAGLWSQVSGPGSSTFSSASSATSNVTANTYGTYVYRWTETNGSCVDFDEVTVVFNEDPQVVSVEHDGDVYCEPGVIELSGIIGGGATTANWSLISGGTGTLSASSLTGSVVTANYIPQSGEFGALVFRLTTNDPAGPCNADFMQVTITTNPTAEVYAGTDDEICENEVYTLNGTMGGAASSITWSGGTGTFSNINDPASTYTPSPADIAAGFVTLTISSNDPDGAGPCTLVSDDVIITINALPEVALTGLQSVYAENDPVVLMEGYPSGGTYSGPGVQPGTNEFDPAAANIGTGTPNAIVYAYTDPSGCYNTDTVGVIVNPATNINFIVDGATQDGAGNFQVCANQGDVRLIGNPSVASGIAPTEFLSDTTGLVSLIGGNYYLKTDGLVSGIYEVTYKYTNSESVTSIRKRNVHILASPVSGFSVTNACSADSINFTDETFIPNTPFATSLVSWNWNFGDGSANATVQNPKHKYATPGIYTVTLITSNDRQCTDIYTRDIRVGELPDVSFNWASICNNQATDFQDMTESVDISSFDSYQWDFGDGNIITGAPGDLIPAGANGGRTAGTFKDPSHDYDATGNYDVTLEVTTNDGCVASATQTLFILPYNTVTPNPQSAYFENFENGTGGWVAAANVINASDTSWVWGVADGDVITSPGNNVWWTGGNDRGYYNSEDSYVYGPCFNLSQLKRPMISLDVQFDTQDGFDGAVIQYSTNQGLTWYNIGDINEGIEWYNQQGIIGRPGDNDSYSIANYNEGDKGWTGLTEEWLSARFSLDDIPKEERNLVRFRIAFASDANNPIDKHHDGFAFDNIYIGDKAKKVLLEHFVDSELDISNQSIGYFETLENETLPVENRDFVMLQYHIDDSGEDPLNDDNESDPSARAIYYGVSQAPVAILDGEKYTTPFDIDQVEIEKRVLDAYFDIAIDTLSATSTSVQAEVTVTALRDFNEEVIVHLAVVENDIVLGNGTTYSKVLKKLLFGGEGESLNITWTNGSSKTLRGEWEINTNLYNGSKLQYVAFVQNRSTKEVYTAAEIDIFPKMSGEITGIRALSYDMVSIYPNPASNTVNFKFKNNFNDKLSYKLVDQRGIEMLDGNFTLDNNSSSIDVSKLAGGIYYVIIYQDDQQIMFTKIAVTHR
ncbi:PKD domain-containing protein [Fulvivirga ligni]|uniref:PKD domain-containing protein n=1 Tax=Fulvivirga ligni TaxID=2904246 RepID=UPI001F2F2D31|nr:PKD domain-containing protein [Fulvivirga ligni]UII24080.1 PKD domain-containing protein [Fulvivirga ligni]